MQGFDSLLVIKQKVATPSKWGQVSNDKLNLNPRLNFVATPSKWGQVSNNLHIVLLVINVMSQPLLNEVRFPIKRICWYLQADCVATPSKWGQVSNGVQLQAVLRWEVATPSKWGQVSNAWALVNVRSSWLSQPLLNEVRFPILFFFDTRINNVVATPSKWGQVSNSLLYFLF